MKHLRIICAITAILLFPLIAMSSYQSNGTEDKNDTVLTGLWKKYVKETDSDRPRKALEVLEEIKSRAREGEYAWDFYKAGEEYISVSASVNWKLRDSLEKRFHEECMDFPSPIVGFHYLYSHWKTDSLIPYLEKNREKMEAGKNPAFYSNVNAYGNATKVIPFIRDISRNDYEFALWAMKISRTALSDKQAGCLLAEYIGSGYPKCAINEYLDITAEENRDKAEAMSVAFLGKYSTEAASMLLKEDILYRRFSELDGKGTPAEYERLRKECDDFEKRLATFSGEEKKIADCCIKVKELAGILDGKDISGEIRDGKAYLYLKNLESASITIRDSGKKVFSVTLKDKGGRYYVTDTLETELPVLDDGDYTVNLSSGSHKYDFEYRKHCISAAIRHTDGHYWIYAADYRSGMPLKGITMELYVNDRLTAVSENVNLDGFTRIPEELEKHISDKSSCQIVCIKEGDVRQNSERIHVYGTKKRNTINEPVSEYATILTNCAAFHPGDTVRYKVIAYKGDPYKSFKAFPEGEELKATLYDASNREVGAETIVTNVNGAACGSFDLGKGTRNGRYRIAIRHGNKNLCNRYLTVDEFTLPSYEVKIDETYGMYFAGEEVSVKGRISSFSGHSLAGVRTVYSVNSGPAENVETDSDGNFTIGVRTDKDIFWYDVLLTVTDQTGETAEARTWFSVHKDLELDVILENAVEGNAEYISGSEMKNHSRIYDNPEILMSGKAEFKALANSMDDIGRLSSFEFRLTKDGVTVQDWKEVTDWTGGNHFTVDFSGLPSGKYLLEYRGKADTADGETKENGGKTTLMFIRENDRVLDADVENVFIPLEDGDITMMFGASDGPIWAIAEISGPEGGILMSKSIFLKGERGKDGSLMTLRYGFENGFPDSACLSLLYFRNGKIYSYSHTYTRKNTIPALPLSIETMEDRTRPSSVFRIGLKTEPFSECAVSVFDKSTEKIEPNLWNPVQLSIRKATAPHYTSVTGQNGSDFPLMLHRNVLYGSTAVKAMAMDANEAMSEEKAMVGSPGGAEVEVREDFSTTLAFEPFLQCDKEGKAGMEFMTSDKLSTFVVQVFVHDKDMRSVTDRKEFMVTVPVKVSVTEPDFLFAGDRYVLQASVSNREQRILNGDLELSLFDGDNLKTASLLSTESKKVCIPGGGSIRETFKIEVPGNLSGSSLGLKLKCTTDSDGYADAMFVSIPVLKPVQTICEGHSAILHPGDNAEAVAGSLRSQFVNVSGYGAEYREKTVLDMVREVLEEKSSATGKDAVSLSEAMYCRLLSGKGNDGENDSLRNLLKCRNTDGGFGWFEGMSSSPVITALILERFSSLDRRELLPDAISGDITAGAVRFLDRSMLSEKWKPFWCGWISMEQYLSVRSLYPGIPLEARIPRERMKAIRQYLTPGKIRGLNGDILDKARRTGTILDLVSSEEGRRLASSLGIRMFTGTRLRSSLKKDIVSLLEYAVTHKSGGAYFPDAVMPFRGLLESEAYAHSMICDLLRDYAHYPDADRAVAEECLAVADNVRLWLMVQKETQKWNGDAGFLEAVSSVMDGSDYVLGTKVISMKQCYEKDFREIKAAGNGFRISRKFLRDGIELKDGDTLNVGDRIVAIYDIWNEENRSFVKVSAWRPASLRPVRQLSERYGWFSRPATVNGFNPVTPQGYREVKAGCSIYWFDTYPEENTSLSEEFFVTQSGVYMTPVMEIESLYAPHYRANSGDSVSIVSE